MLWTTGCRGQICPQKGPRFSRFDSETVAISTAAGSSKRGWVGGRGRRDEAVYLVGKRMTGEGVICGEEEGVLLENDGVLGKWW